MRERVVATATAVLLVAASAVAGAPPSGAPRVASWRLIAGPALAGSSLGTTYGTRYSPPFFYTTYTSDATQRLPLDAGLGPGAHIAIERDLAAHVGLQLSTDYAAADVSGDPGRYDLTTRYISRQPPYYEPVELVQRRSLDWPAATGRLKSFALALDLVAFAPLGTRGRLGVAVGPAWLGSRGRAESLVYTVYRMGGHSTSFYEDHVVSFSFPADALALDAGTFVEADLGSRVGLRLDARYTWAPERHAAVSVEDVVNADEVINALSPAEIQRGLEPGPVRLDPSLFRASLSLVVRF